MKIKKILLASFLIVNSLLSAQIRATISEKSCDLESVDIPVGDLVITLDRNGEIGKFYSDLLNGDIEYYEDIAFDQNRLGKLKSIGNHRIEYGDVLNDLKIKSIGDVNIEYWGSFDREKAGKVKRIGDVDINYWNTDITDNSKEGKLKSIGNILIDYGRKDITDQSRYRKLIQFGPVHLDYWNDRIMNKNKFGKLKSIKGNTKEVSVAFL